MKTIGERFDEMAETAGVSKTDKGYYFGRSCCFQIATEQKTRTLNKVYNIITEELGESCGTALIKVIQNAFGE